MTLIIYFNEKQEDGTLKHTIAADRIASSESSVACKINKIIQNDRFIAAAAGNVGFQTFLEYLTAYHESEDKPVATSPLSIFSAYNDFYNQYCNSTEKETNIKNAPALKETYDVFLIDKFNPDKVYNLVLEGEDFCNVMPLQDVDFMALGCGSCEASGAWETLRLAGIPEQDRIPMVFKVASKTAFISEEFDKITWINAPEVPPKKTKKSKNG